MIDSSRKNRSTSIDLRYESTDLEALLRASLRPLIAYADRERIQLRVDALGSLATRTSDSKQQRDPLPPVVIDREKIAWCVATLVGNALRYVRTGSDADRGGSVLVQLHVESEHENEHEHEHEHGHAHEEVLAIAVHDDGPGIPDAKLPYLFERKAGSLYAEGLTLGLIREIITAHGGDIRVESRRRGRDENDESGTSITLRLPLTIGGAE